METKDKIGLGIISVLLVALCLFIGLYVHNKNKLTIAEHNITALQDTVTTVKTANGELLSYKNSLVIDKKELEQNLGITKKEVKELEKTLDSKLLYISKIKSGIKYDTITIKDSIVVTDKGIYRYKFNNSTNYYTIAGYTDVYNTDSANTVITDNITNLNLKVGLDKDWKIFVESENPYVSITDIDGALVDKSVFLKQEKKKRFGIGIQAGFGGQYGLVHKTFDYGPYIGIGISYNFIIF